jgi:hypothetical protein
MSLSPREVDNPALHLFEYLVCKKDFPFQTRMDVRKRGENPPLPRSREGNENPESHCHGETMMGRRMSRQP